MVPIWKIFYANNFFKRNPRDKYSKFKFEPKIWKSLLRPANKANFCIDSSTEWIVITLHIIGKKIYLNTFFWLFYYVRFFSEENIWRLCDAIRKHQPEQLKYARVVFISNDIKQVEN